MGMKQLKAEFNELVEDNDALVLVLFNMAQDLVQDVEDTKEAEALNIITGSAFALYHALQHYKEVKNGKSVKNSSRFADSENGSRLS